MHKFITLSLTGAVLLTPLASFAQDRPDVSPRLRLQAPQLPDVVRDQFQRVTDIHDNIRESQSDRQQERAEKMAALRERLANFSDENKAALVERIANHLNNINDRLTARWAQILDRMSDILARAENRANELGLDISEELAEAQSAIDTAQDAVSEQADKDYTLEISDEDRVGAIVSAARQALHEDLTAVREALREARGAIKEVFEEIREELSGEDEDEDDEEEDEDEEGDEDDDQE